jgi:hypothetical protein
MPVVCTECGFPHAGLRRVEITWDEFYDTERCSNCDRTWHLSPCEDCKVLTCEGCWDAVGCIECNNNGNKED